MPTERDRRDRRRAEERMATDYGWPPRPRRDRLTPAIYVLSFVLSVASIVVFVLARTGTVYLEWPVPYVLLAAAILAALVGWDREEDRK